MTRKPRTSARDRIFESPRVVLVAPPNSARGAPASDRPHAAQPAKRTAQADGDEPRDPDSERLRLRGIIPPAYDVDDDPIGELDDDTIALLLALAEYESADDTDGRALSGEAFNTKHPRGPDGRFLHVIDRIKDALAKHQASGGKGDPFPGFDREQLRRAAKSRGITLKRGEDRDSIVAKLLADLGPGDTKKSPAGPKKLAGAAKKSATEADVRSGDFSGLRRVGPQGGSNKGGVFEAADGSRWYVKAQKSEAHAKNEAAAAALYREAGVDVPAVHRGSGLEDLGDGPQTATRILDGAEPDLLTRFEDDDYVAAVRRGFAVDAWLGNWDVVGASMDNIVTVDGKPHRVDVGGSLLFRAQGAPKGAAFGKSVLEWATLRDPSKAPQASAFFADITPEQLQESAKLVEAIKPARIRQLVDDPDLAQLLIDRRKDLLARARRAGAAQPSFDTRIARAKKGKQALDAPSITLQMDTDLAGSVPASWDQQRRAEIVRALVVYRGSGYGAINDTLREDYLVASELVKGYVSSMDEVLAASPLPHEVVVHRAIKHPAVVFGSAWPTSEGGSAVGLTWTDNGFTSTSADDRVPLDGFTGGAAKETSGPEAAVMRIVVPKGIGAVGMSEMDTAPAPYNSPDLEAEVLLERGLTFRVVADRGYTPGTRVRQLDVEVVPV